MLLAGAFFVGCSEPLTTTEKGAGIGTLAGASLGGVIGNATGHAGAGAGIGAAIGLIGGALVGEQVQEEQRQQRELQRQIAEQQSELDRVSQELQQLKKSLTALLKHYSPALDSALTQRSLGIDSLLGGSNLSYKVSQIREAMCIVHGFLDHDKSGLDAFKKAEMEGLMTLADVNFATCDGMQDSEIEDIYDVKLYSQMLQNKYAVSTLSPKFKGKHKWSQRLRDTFKNHGKPWSDTIEMKVKHDIADLVERKPGGRSKLSPTRGTRRTYSSVGKQVKRYRS